jgi:hypothetical protein
VNRCLRVIEDKRAISALARSAEYAADEALHDQAHRHLNNDITEERSCHLRPRYATPS